MAQVQAEVQGFSKFLFAQNYASRLEHSFAEVQIRIENWESAAIYSTRLAYESRDRIPTAIFPRLTMANGDSKGLRKIAEEGPAQKESMVVE